MFFELLKQGELTLLSRESCYVDNWPFVRSFYVPGRSWGDFVMKEDYYRLVKNHNLIKLIGIKDQLLDMMA